MFFLGFVLAASIANAQTFATFGLATSVATGTQSYAFSTVLNFCPCLNVTFTNNEATSVSVTITNHLASVSFFLNTWTALNAGLSGVAAGMVQSYAALSIGLDDGFTISTTPTNANVAVTISFGTPDPGQNFLSQANVNAGLLQVGASATASAYTRIPCNYVASPYTFQAMIPSPCNGDYAIAAINEQVNVSASIAAAMVIAPAACNQTFAFSIASASGYDLQIKFQSMTQNNITVTPYANPPSHTQPSKMGAWVPVFFNVTLADAQAQQNSQVTYTYTNAQVQAAASLAKAKTTDATNLVWYYALDGGAWIMENTEVTVSAGGGTVTCATTHFSDWGLYYTGAGAALKIQLGVFAVLLLLCFHLL